MKLKFVADAFYNGELTYKNGQVVEIDDKLGMASRWIKRGLAVSHVEEEKPILKSDIKEEILPKDLVKGKNKAKKTGIDL